MRARRGARVAAPLATTVAALLVAFAILEGVVVRWVLPAPDVPEVELRDGVLRYRPGQTGVWRVGDDVAAPFRINAQGWNSGHARYRAARTPGRRRIAVVGDSYVAALQVAPEASFAEVLERELGADRAEVYRFGMDGAPLSQHLHVLEREVLAYAPDDVVILLVHNDFVESFRRHPGRYTRSFMVLDLAGDGIREVPPAPYRETWVDPLRRLALARYFLYRRKLTYAPPVLALKAALFGAPEAADAGYVANVAPNEIVRHRAEIAVAVDHLFGRLAALARRRDLRLLLVMDAVRATITTPGADDQGAAELNVLAARLARRHGLALFDLHETFRGDWEVRHAPFGFATDGHWNAAAHRLVGRAVAARLAGAAPSR